MFKCTSPILKLTFLLFSSSRELLKYFSTKIFTKSRKDAKYMTTVELQNHCEWEAGGLLQEKFIVLHGMPRLNTSANL